MQTSTKGSNDKVIADPDTDFSPDTDIKIPGIS